MFVHSVNCGCAQHGVGDRPHKTRSLWIALFLIGGFSILEFAMSATSGSLALLAEAGHMLSDCAALGLALLAAWIGQLPATDRAPFGYRRVEILAALVNGLGLVAIALWVGWEALARLQAPSVEIVALPMLATAILGLIINLINISLLHPHSHNDLNLKGAFLHMVADALGAIGVIGAAVAVYALGWTWADSAISLVVAGFIGIGAIPLVRESLAILLEKAPSYVDVAAVRATLEAMQGVRQVEHLRLWAIAPGQDTLSAHLVIEAMDGEMRDRLLQELETTLAMRFGLRDVCLQMRAPGSAPLPISLSPDLALLGVVGDRGPSA